MGGLLQNPLKNSLFIWIVSIILSFKPKNSIIPLGVTIAESDNLIESKRIEGELTRIIQITNTKKFYCFELERNK